MSKQLRVDAKYYKPIEDKHEWNSMEEFYIHIDRISGGSISTEPIALEISPESIQAELDALLAEHSRNTQIKHKKHGGSNDTLDIYSK